MSRRSDLYGATPELQLETDGKISDMPGWAVKPYPRRRAIFLVHGYNTGGSKAVRNLRAFRAQLELKSPALRHETLVTTWAGRRWLGPLGALAYVTTLQNAVESSNMLLQAIDEWCEDPKGTSDIVLVAHSMGCRLVAETLLRMAARHPSRPPGLERLTVILMAAAVPVYMVEPGGGLWAALDVPDKVVLLHSQDDWILRRVFPIGQKLAGEGPFPQAVGLLGKGPEPTCVREDVKPTGHLSYWTSEQVAETVRMILDAPLAAFSHLGTIATPPRLPQAPLLPMAPLPAAG